MATDLAGQPPGAHPASRRAAALLTALLPLLALAAGCGEGETPRTLAPDTPIVLISIDTLRSDRLPVYGYTTVDTPALDRFAAEAIVYEHAYSPIPLTLPSHASMLTGLLPPDHGVRDNMGFRLVTADLPYLPRILRQKGYATGAAVSSFVLRGSSGIASDFDFYDDKIEFSGDPSNLGSVQRPGGSTLEIMRPWLSQAAGGPFFAFFHIYEPHAPFKPPEPFASRYRSPYDGEVAAADAIIGDFLDELRQLGVYDKALVILTSDHGEGLGEHGYTEHGPFLYREALQVPLIVKLPGQRRGGTRVAAPAQLADITPTVLEAIGEEIPAQIRGSSLLRLADGEVPQRRIYSETLYPRLHFGWSELASIIDYPLHYIHGPGPELFDLESDPGETVNLAERKRRELAELRAEVETYDLSIPTPMEEDAETRDRLAALGYVGTSAAVADGPLPNPRDKVQVLDGLSDGVTAFFEGRYEESVAILREVLEEEPGIIDGWSNLGRCLMKMNRPAEAYEAYRRGLELSNGAPQLALPAASALLRLGRLDAAREHAEIAAPTFDAAQDVLAQIALRQARLDDAATHVDKALATRGGRIGPLITAAELELRRRNFAEAVEKTRAAEAEAAESSVAPETLRGLYYVRGAALARLGEAEAAERALEREIELTPDALPAYAELALLYALQGRAADAGRTLGRMVETNDVAAAYAAAVTTLRQMGDEGSARRVLAQALGRWPQAPELLPLTR